MIKMTKYHRTVTVVNIAQLIMTGRARQRLMRPVERQPMKDWLSDKLNAKEIPGLEWVNRDQKVFRIKWCHGSRHGWSLKDSVLFEKWAHHSGKYNDGDPKRWKANFRCALNSLKDVEEVKGMSISKGQNAFKVYRMLDSRKKTEKSRVTKRLKSEPDQKCVPKDNKRVLQDVAVRTSSRLSAQAVLVKTEAEDQSDSTENESDSEGYQTEVQEDTDMDWTPAEERVTFPAFSTVTKLKTEDLNSSSQIPNFDKIIPGFYKVETEQNPNKNILEFGKDHWLPRHGSGFKVEQLKQQTPLTPILQSFQVQLPESIISQLKISTGNRTSPHTTPSKELSAIPSVSGMASVSTTKKATSFTPSASQVRETATPSLHAQTKFSHRVNVPTNSQLAGRDSSNYMTFPETPDGSEVSHDSNSSEFIELTIYEEEVADTPHESTADCIVLTDLSKTTFNTFHNINGLEQYGPGHTGLTTTPYIYNPLTPP
ncbi:interferon regulatory factor 2-like isoform X2 [Mercenaria mercenaria]|uniref:interferon regulatory factor 2-like isoform X2 n=1 Tax=Mercenaria mercenaria TaxID=6596 RepID=UPI00234E4D36|nr:interferon regulatory factor 2-like isoform X2 [Mercenaria mercenaria]